MNRRRFLQFLGLGTAAAALAPEMLLDPDRALWVPGAKKIFDLGATPPLEAYKQAFRIVLPDGTVYSFDGYLEALRPSVSVDGLMETSVQVQPMNLRIDEPLPPPNTWQNVGGMGRLTTNVPAQISILGEKPVVLSDIQLPSMSRNEFDVTVLGDTVRTRIEGIPRNPSMEFSIEGAFEPETVEKLFRLGPKPSEKPRRRT